MNGNRPKSGVVLATIQRLPVDVVLGIVWLALAYGATFLSAGSPVRIFATLATLLVLPGYALTTALFPATSQRSGGSILGGTENGTGTRFSENIEGLPSLPDPDRAALSFGLSVASLPLLALLVESLFGTYEVEGVLAVLTAFVSVAFAVGVVRRWRIPATERYELPLDRWLSTCRSTVRYGNGWDMALNVGLAAVIVLSMSTLAVALVAPQDGTEFTETYLLADQGDGDWAAKNYPTDLERGESVPLMVVVANQEDRDVNYAVVVSLQRLDDGNVTEREILNRFQHRVADGESWRKSHQVTPTMTGERLRLAYLLYTGSAPENPTAEGAYRTVSIRIDVGG